MAENDKNLKIEAIRCAAGINSAHVAAAKDVKPEDVVGLAKKIYEFLKG
jgi:hypothetical protein